MKRIRFSLALGVLVLSACQNNVSINRSAVNQQNSQQRSLEQYYPLNAGRRWTFALEQKQNGVDNTKFKSMTMYTETLSPANGAERAVLHRMYPDSAVKPNPSLAQRFNDRVELSRYQPESQTNEAPTLMILQIPTNHPLTKLSRNTNYITALQMPLQVGQKWPGRVFQDGTETLTVKGFEPVHVPAGRFDAVVIEHHLRYDNGKEDFLRYWYAPGIGMVKMHEEITAYFSEWLKLESDGVLTEFKP